MAGVIITMIELTPEDILKIKTENPFYSFKYHNEGLDGRLLLLAMVHKDENRQVIILKTNELSRTVHLKDWDQSKVRLVGIDDLYIITSFRSFVGDCSLKEIPIPETTRVNSEFNARVKPPLN
jgi:hypothetical protein